MTRQTPEPSAEMPETQNIRPVAPGLTPSHKPAHEASQHDTPHADSGQRTAELANQPHTTPARQHVIGQHSEWAAEREETRQREHERELASAREVNKPDAEQYNPWDHTVAAVFVNRYMEAAEREDEAEMLKLAEAYAETPDYKELEAQGEEILRQWEIEQQQQQQMQQQHTRVLSR